jgi:hypothetical protein
MRSRLPQAPAALLPALVGIAIAGCGDDGTHPNEPRPASPINVSAAITDTRVAVSPRRFGAGPIVLVVSNQTEQPRAVTFETDEIAGPGPGVRQTTSPINPAGTARLQLDVRRGTYRLSAGDDGPRPASIRVGPPRPSAQDALLQP